MGEYAQVNTSGNGDLPPEGEASISAPGASITISGDETEGKGQENLEAQPSVSEGQPERDPGLPEKFKSTGDLAAAYAELERKQSEAAAVEQNRLATENAQLRAQLAGQTTPDGTPAPVAGAPEGENKAELTAPPQFQAATPEALSTFVQEYSRDGRLSEQSYQDLQFKFNLGRAMADSHIQAKRAQAELHAEQAMSGVGGSKEFSKATAWAQEHLTDGEVRIFNEDLGSGNEMRIKSAITNLAARYAAGKSPNLVAGTAATQSVSGFSSDAQIAKAVNDPRYEEDPSYRREVEAKIMASNM